MVLNRTSLLPAAFGTALALGGELPAYGKMVPAWHAKHPECSPILLAIEPRGTTLDVMASDDKPGLVVREFSDWKSVWVGAYTISAPVLRGILRYAGVHTYDDAEDIIYANRNWLAVHFARDGERTVRLPGRADVVDAWTGQPVGRGESSSRVKARRGQTHIFRLKFK